MLWTIKHGDFTIPLFSMDDYKGQPGEFIWSFSDFAFDYGVAKEEIKLTCCSHAWIWEVLQQKLKYVHLIAELSWIDSPLNVIMLAECSQI